MVLEKLCYLLLPLINIILCRKSYFFIISKQHVLSKFCKANKDGSTLDSKLVIIIKKNCKKKNENAEALKRSGNNWELN